MNPIDPDARATYSISYYFWASFSAISLVISSSMMKNRTNFWIAHLRLEHLQIS